MKTNLFLFLICLFTASAHAQSNRDLSSFFSEGYVQHYFHYAHVNAGRFNGIDVDEVSRNKVVLKASFEPNFYGSTYVCTINVYLDNKGRFIHVNSHCDSPSRFVWHCFDSATAELKSKCEKMPHRRRAIDFMEQYYGKSFRQFNEQETMCTLLNIVWFNYN